MEIILSKNCLSLTGMLNTELGYYIRSTKKGRFYSQRSKHFVPPDGHWRFIVICAELAQKKLYITDIRVSGYEIRAALTEAAFLASAYRFDPDYEYSADEFLDLKKTLGL